MCLSMKYKERNKILEETKQKHDFLFIKQDGTPASVELGETWCAKWEKFLNYANKFLCDGFSESGLMCKKPTKKKINNSSFICPLQPK